MQSLLILIDTVLNLYTWCLIISIILSWLFAFNVVNASNRLVYTLADFFHRLTEPALRPIRERLPNIGGIDLSPLALIVGIWFLRLLLREYWPQ